MNFPDAQMLADRAHITAVAHPPGVGMLSREAAIEKAGASDIGRLWTYAITEAWFVEFTCEPPSAFDYRHRLAWIVKFSGIDEPRGGRQVGVPPGLPVRARVRHKYVFIDARYGAWLMAFGVPEQETA